MLKARRTPCHGECLLRWLGEEVLVHGSLEADVNSSMMANKFLGGETFFSLMNLEAEKMVTKACCVMILL